jgi:hypothetical protein
MTIGNLSSKIRKMPSTHTVAIVALRLIPMQSCNIPQKRLDEQRQTNREVLNKVLRRELQPCSFKHNPNTKSGYYNVPCADGNFRCWKPIIAAWFADGPKYSELHHFDRHECFLWECAMIKYGDFVPYDKQYPRWDHNLFRTITKANTRAADAELSSCHVRQGFNVCRHFLYIVSNVPMPDHLEKMHIAILDYLEQWIFHLLNRNERLDKYNSM